MFIIFLLKYDLALELTLPVTLLVILVPILFRLSALTSPSILAVVYRRDLILLMVMLNIPQTILLYFYLVYSVFILRIKERNIKIKLNFLTC